MHEEGEYKMSDVYFSADEGGYTDKYPTCDYISVYRGVYELSLKVRLDDPKLEQIKEKYPIWSEIKSGIHYFDDHGFPQCKVCGWTP